MKKMLFGTLASCLILASCSKSDDPTPVAPAADKFMSLTAGSSWNYAFTDNNTPANNNNYTLTSTNRDSTAAGKSYHVFTNSNNGRNEYYNITGSDYYTLQAFSLGGTDTTLENLYLKDNAALNTTWDQNYTLDLGLPVGVTVTNKIVGKDISKTVGTKTFTGVIDVLTTINIPTLATLPGSSLTTDIHYYYAPRYGMIENDAKIDLDVPAASITQHTDTKTTLVSANF